MLHTQEAVNLNKKIDSHVEECAANFAEGREQFTQLKECSEATTQAVNKLAGDMEPIIALREDLKGAANLGMRIQKFGLFIIKWPVIGAGLYAIYNWAIDLIPR